MKNLITILLLCTSLTCVADDKKEEPNALRALKGTGVAAGGAVTVLGTGTVAANTALGTSTLAAPAFGAVLLAGSAAAGYGTGMAFSSIIDEPLGEMVGFEHGLIGTPLGYAAFKVVNTSERIIGKFIEKDDKSESAQKRTSASR